MIMQQFGFVVYAVAPEHFHFRT